MQRRGSRTLAVCRANNEPSNWNSLAPHRLAVYEATSGSVADMVKLDGGAFLMGTEDDEGFPQDGEGPVRQVTLDPFYMDVYPVTNSQFLEFAAQTQYRTDAEKFGWSFVFQGHIPPERYDGTGSATGGRRAVVVPGDGRGFPPPGRAGFSDRFARGLPGGARFLE